MQYVRKNQATTTTLTISGADHNEICVTAALSKVQEYFCSYQASFILEREQKFESQMLRMKEKYVVQRINPDKKLRFVIAKV